MATITFRSITPIYNLEFSPSNIRSLDFSGQYGDAVYSVKIGVYDVYSDEFKKAMGYVKLSEQKIISRNVISHDFSGPEIHLLIVDVVQPLTEKRKLMAATSESDRITRAMLDAMIFNSSRGVIFDTVFEVSDYKGQYNFGMSQPLVPPSPFSHIALGGKSVLSEKNFQDAEITFHQLSNKNWDDTIAFGKILNLAIQYHKVIFTLERVDHDFLLLMIIFEALFKKKDERNLSKPSVRVAKLLSNTKADAKKIQKDFFDSDVNSFNKIRNDIAHGDPALDIKIVESKFLLLYKYITASIVSLVSISNSLDFTRDYYDEISRYVDNRFTHLL